MKNIFTLCIILTFLSVKSQVQESVKIGNQEWTSENLSVSKFRNGDIINQSKTKEEWLRAGYREEPTWCYYKFDEANSTLGKLYNYYSVSSEKNIAPQGWKVPDFFDYFKLIKFLDPLITYEHYLDRGTLAGGSLKSKNQSHWKENNCKQIDSKFNAIASGGYTPSINYPKYDWEVKGEKAFFWCITDWNKIANEVLTGDNFQDEKEDLMNDIKSGELLNKALVFRLNKFCGFDIDDDPKERGYSVRLIRE